MTLVLCLFAILSFVLGIVRSSPDDAIYWATGCALMAVVAFR